MLSTSTSTWVARAGAAVALLLGLLVVVVPTAATADPVCNPPAVMTGNPDGTYSCTVPGGGGGSGDGGGPSTPGGGGGDGAGTPAPATCDLYSDFTFCLGESACKQFEGHPPYRAPEGPQPEGSTWMVRLCDVAGYETWYAGPGEEPQPPSLAEQAQTAVGQIDLPLLTLRTSPTGRTVVNLPTWFWVEGGGGGPATGSSAFGLVAIATLQRLEVDPGDGRGWQPCPLVASAEEAEESCSFTYDRASWDGSASYEGRPAHEAAVRSRWTLTFEVGGNAVTVPGAPAELTGPVSTAVVRVDEVQSVVRSTG